MMAIVDKLKAQSIGYYKHHDIILGKGNFATVYLAHHKIIGCEVALKVINTDKIEEEYVFQNLEREAHILKQLHHSNIIRLYEIVKSDNLYCLSLERIRGVNLYQYMMKQKSCKISEKLARVFFYQMLSAVKFMHGLQVIHRDLKLENILVEFGHIIKIIDFGLSNVYYPCVRLRTHCGSVEYAAPELFRSASAYGLPVDLWSLGVILYAMVVGRMPFSFNREKPQSGSSAVKREQFLQRISKGLTQDNWILMEGLSPDCWKILHALLEPDQFHRLRIYDAMDHPWITKDEHLRKRLPQSRKDLQRKFRPEIIEYLSDILNTSKMRIEMHVNAGYYSNNVACMFYILRDILVKEVLYPPKNFPTTFLYRFEGWKRNRTSFYRIHRRPIEYQPEQLSERMGKAVYYSSKVLTRTGEKSQIKIADDTKVCADVTDSTKPVRKVCRNLVESKPTEHNVEKAEQKVVRYPSKSYKSSRPVKVRNVSGDKTKNNLEELKHDVGGKAPVKVYRPSSPHQKRISREYTAKQKDDSSKSHPESSTLLTSDTSNKQLEPATHIKLKCSITKTPKAEERQLHPENIRVKTCASMDDNCISDFKGIESRKQENVVVKRVSKNITPKEVKPSFTSTTRRFTNAPRRVGGSKNIQIEAPSRISVRSVRYGPPAPFSQSADKRTKLKRTTVADRINFGIGDVNGKSEQK